jgi:predicted nucleic acid-binding protein
MAWCFEDEKTPYTESILDAVSAGAIAIVPALWQFEVLNVLVIAQRRKRILQAKALHFWRELQSFSIRIDEKAVAHSSLEVMALADQHQLTAYDATYLELALREGVPLATLDEDLKKAAKSAGVPIAHP